MTIAIAIVLYLVSSFLMAALFVRQWPKSWLGRKVRFNLPLTVFFPFLLIYAWMRSTGRKTNRFTLSQRVFERISGHRTGKGGRPRSRRRRR